MVRSRLLIDYWNIQHGWNRFSGKDAQGHIEGMAWRRLPKLARELVAPRMRELEALPNNALFESRGDTNSVRLVAGLTPVADGHDRHRQWMYRTFRDTLGWELEVYTNPKRSIAVACRDPRCNHSSRRCPKCDQTLLHYPEKRVDVDLATDLLMHAAGKKERAVDLTILCSGDTDFVPAVEAAQSMGHLVACVTWHGESNELFQACDVGATLNDVGARLALP